MMQRRSRNPGGQEKNWQRKKQARKAVDYKALAQFRHQLRMFLAFSETNAQIAGLTSQHYQALLTIKGSPNKTGMSVGELAELLLVKHHAAGELASRMARLELLRKTVDASDNRRVLVTLTKKGATRLERVAKLNFEHLEAASFTLSETLRLIVKPSR